MFYLYVCVNYIFCHPVVALLHGSENALVVMPWLDHGIQKIIKKY
ncbi:MAG: hypothetical protein ACRYE8_01930 [Janthinobacterium lividum]